MPQGDPRSGEKYLHFKNKLYQVVAIAEHSETGEKLVVYQALYGDFRIYARPLLMFISEVDHEKYPQAEQKYRFQLMEACLEGKAPATEESAHWEESEEKPNKTVKKDITDLLMDFYDASTYEEKYNILTAMQDDITDTMINNMAVVLDVVIPEGETEKRCEELKRCLRTYQKYENSRLR